MKRRQQQQRTRRQQRQQEQLQQQRQQEQQDEEAEDQVLRTATVVHSLQSIRQIFYGTDHQTPHWLYLWSLTPLQVLVLTDTTSPTNFARKLGKTHVAYGKELLPLESVVVDEYHVFSNPHLGWFLDRGFLPEEERYIYFYFDQEHVEMCPTLQLPLPIVDTKKNWTLVLLSLVLFSSSCYFTIYFLRN